MIDAVQVNWLDHSALVVKDRSINQASDRTYSPKKVVNEKVSERITPKQDTAEDGTMMIDTTKPSKPWTPLPSFYDDDSIDSATVRLLASLQD